MSTEIENLSALLDACGARRVFGLSAGAVIAIEVALVRRDITKLALYEPPLTFDGDACVIRDVWPLVLFAGWVSVGVTARSRLGPWPSG